MNDEKAPIVLTDPAPLPETKRRGCPRCGAPASELVPLGAYRPNGPKVCQRCGHEPEASR